MYIRYPAHTAELEAKVECEPPRTSWASRASRRRLAPRERPRTTRPSVFGSSWRSSALHPFPLSSRLLWPLQPRQIVRATSPRIPRVNNSRCLNKPSPSVHSFALETPASSEKSIPAVADRGGEPPGLGLGFTRPSKSVFTLFAVDVGSESAPIIWGIRCRPRKGPVPWLSVGFDQECDGQADVPTPCARPASSSVSM